MLIVEQDLRPGGCSCSLADEIRTLLVGKSAAYDRIPKEKRNLAICNLAQLVHESIVHLVAQRNIPKDAVLRRPAEVDRLDRDFVQAFASEPPVCAVVGTH